MRRAAKWVALASTVLAWATVISPSGAFAARAYGTQSVRAHARLNTTLANGSVELSWVAPTSGYVKLLIAAYGTSLSVVGERCTGCGQVKIYLDGVLKATVDTHANSTSIKQLLWTSTSSTLRRHTLSVVVVGTAHRPAVRIDGLVARR